MPDVSLQVCEALKHPLAFRKAIYSLQRTSVSPTRRKRVWKKGKLVTQSRQLISLPFKMFTLALHGCFFLAEDQTGETGCYAF